MRNQLSHDRTFRCRFGLGYSAVAVFFIIICAASASLGQDASAQANRDKSKNGGNSVARGKYIVEGVSVCSQCHTPRTSAGRLDRSKWLQGAPVGWKPADPSTDWPLQAPRIAGTPPGSDAEMITLLTTGLWRNGKPLRPPMPQFRMSPEDAQAVVAYLRSLTPSSQ